MTAKRTLAIAIVLASCRSSSSCLHAEQTRNVALGWRGSVDGLFSPSCVPVATHPTKVVSTGSDYEAVAVGIEDFTCGDTVTHVRVAPAVRIAIDFPASVVVWEQHPLVVWGDDGSGGRLDLGGQYTDTPSGALERAVCGDMDFLCGVGGEMLVAHTPGPGTVTVSFRGLTATHAVVATTRSDAGAD